ncbi:type I DNA topoisomerase [Aphanothece hegewaldii CCALA 016]|uniref:DNA topoisomerase 1 n=1 Tax=Aphanothece hegewaldii CCALA 016 TaxID=2107694 RepID=A0A2T1LT06_9CHRO|nr:type I DNA topoisomerase [Aphanothece hegewaldii]PSF33340.1 type I DNA topoisomerase [Aphanothece hegewaldii CCALA 016]
MSKKLFLIEAPGKIKKLRQILGSEYLVRASGGHIRELAKDGDDHLGFDLNKDSISCRFLPRNSQAKKTIAELKELARQVDTVILATDEDREGEIIAWHLKEVMNLRNPQRVTYREITPAAVQEALKQPRPIDSNLVNAALARSVLDKLVGFKGSPLVWKLNNGAKSIGRVQSAALHILCQREREIGAFKPQDYWLVTVTYSEGFKAYYLGENASTQPHREETEERDDAGEGEERKIEATKVLSEAEADRLVSLARQSSHKVFKVEGKTVSKTPPAPFTTSSLQQAAGSRLKWSPEKTMQVAQNLYEGGHITYMRTDSVYLDPQFCQTVKQWLEEKDPQNVPAKVTTYRQSKTAQEAHEAIRPTDIRKPSSELKQEIAAEEFELYLLIWLRTVASQCKSAQIVKSRIITQSGSLFWQAKGQIVTFAGYAKYWKDITADSVLPQVSPKQPLNLEEASHEKKQTQPPPRYTEAKLVQVLERRGIGRPSTFAPTVKTLKERGYAEVQKRQLQATTLGLEVDAFLQKTLPELLEAEFTASMEDKLDAIASGQENWERYIIDWNEDYFAVALEKALKVIESQPVSKANPPKANVISPAGKESKFDCPCCGQKMVEVPSKSQKLHKDYFLKCSSCQAVMFYNKWRKVWELPVEKPENPSSLNSKPLYLTDHACPVCGKKLAIREYEKDGQKKRMLVCSSGEARTDKKHQGVAYFESRNVFWSKKYGELPIA